MRRFVRSLGLLATLVSLIAPAAVADQVCTSAILNSTTARTVSCDTSRANVAIVEIAAASGSPDGTAQIYIDGASLGSNAQYATPTTLKVFRGPVGGTLTVTLLSNTTGTVSVVVRLK